MRLRYSIAMILLQTRWGFKIWLKWVINQALDWWSSFCFARGKNGKKYKRCFHLQILTAIAYCLSRHIKKNACLFSCGHLNCKHFLNQYSVLLWFVSHSPIYEVKIIFYLRGKKYYFTPLQTNGKGVLISCLQRRGL